MFGPPKEENPERPWERQPWDLAPQWEAFQRFLMMPRQTRDLEPLVKELRVSLGQLMAWSNAGHWIIRAQCWDSYLETLRGEAWREEQEALAAARTDAYRAARDATRAARRISAAAAQCPVMAPDPLVALKLDEGAQRLRAALPAAPPAVEPEPEPDYSLWTDEEMAAARIVENKKERLRRLPKAG